jgi:hypothetical protein
MYSENNFQRQREDIYTYKLVDLPVNADDEYKCIPKLVEKLADEFMASLELHSKVLSIRVDLHSKQVDTSNSAVEEILRWLKQDLKRSYRMKNIGHFWVREYGKKKKTHWHLVLLLDGNILQNAWAVNERLKTYWEQVKNYGEVKIPKNCYTQIKKGDHESFKTAFYRSSYLTKERSKFVGNHRSFGASRLATKVKTSACYNQ